MTIREEEEKETKLHIGARLNNLQLVRAALREGLDVDALGINGWTALHEAASCGYLETTIAILDGGADPNIQDHQKCTPLHLAARTGHLEVVRSLVRCGARMDLRNAEGKIPQNCAKDDCREFLARQRAEEVIKGSPSPIADNSVRKLYGPKSSQSPVLKKHRQSSPQWSESSQSSRESMTSASSSGSSESFSGSSPTIYQPGPGEMRVSVDLNPNRQYLSIHVGEIKDVKLPADHNMSHIYVKGYLIPDKYKNTKRKTSYHRLQRAEEGRSSRDSVTSLDGEDDVCEKRSERRMSQRIVSSLKRGTRSSSQKKKSQEQIKSIAQQGDLVPVFRISTKFDEAFRYNADELRRVNLETCHVLLTICGRNRLTTGGQPIACISLPLVGYAKMVTPEWYPLTYKITLPSGYDVAQERESLRGSRSWEEKEGKFTGRSLAWAMSMPNIDMSTSQPSARHSIQGGEGGFPPSGATRYKKHSGPGRLLKNEFKLMQGKGNDRYKKSPSTQELDKEGRARDNFSVKIAERSSTIPGASRGGIDLNKVLLDQNRDIAEKIKGHSGYRRRSTASNIGLHEYSVSHEQLNDVTEIVTLKEEEEQNSRPELEHRSSFTRSLKYSRAFQQQASATNRRDVVLNDLDVEDFEEISDAPFAVNNFRGQQSGIACN